MSRMEHQLMALDEQLESFGTGTRWFIYLGFGIGIIFTSWMLIASDMVNELAALKSRTSTLETTIIQNSPEAYKNKIADIDRTLLEKERSIAELKQKQQLLLLEMSDSKGLLFDNRHYATMLDLLLEYSVRKGLKIELMESVDTDQVFFGKVKQLKRLTVVGTGKFPAIAEFLSFVEEQNTLVQIKSVQIRSDETHPRFSAVILYMGVQI